MTEAPIAVAPVPEYPVPLECAVALPESTIESVYGFAVPERETELDPFAVAQLRQSGTHSCAWASESPYALVYLTVQREGAARHVALDPDVIWDGSFGLPESRMSCKADGYVQCQAYALVGDYLVHMYAGLASAGSADPVAALHTLFDPALDTLASAPVPGRWERAEGDWPLVVDCAAIGSAVDLGAAGGLPGMPVRDVTGSDEGSLAPMPRDLAAIGGATSCWWTPPHGEAPAGAAVDRIFVATLAGGAWLWEELLPSTTAAVEELDIPGADDAALVCGIRCAVYLRYGTNVASVAGSLRGAPSGAEVLVPIAEAVAPVIPIVVP